MRGKDGGAGVIDVVMPLRDEADQLAFGQGDVSEPKVNAFDVITPRADLWGHAAGADRAAGPGEQRQEEEGAGHAADAQALAPDGRGVGIDPAPGLHRSPRRARQRHDAAHVSTPALKQGLTLS